MNPKSDFPFWSLESVLILGLTAVSVLFCAPGVPEKAEPVLAPTFANVHAHLSASCAASGCHDSVSVNDDTDPVDPRWFLTGDLADDYELLRADEARINIGKPEASLLLTNATGETPHTGGAVLVKNSDGYNLILRWIQNGAPSEVPQN